MSGAFDVGEDKITSIKSYIIKIPVEIRLSSDEVKETSHLITEIHTSSGIIGIGEGTPYAIRGKSHSNIYNAYMLCRKVAKELKGKKLDEAKDMLPRVQERFMEKSFFDYAPFLALETALLDAISKLSGVRFSKIIGGNFRDKVPVCGTVFLGEPKRMAETARRWVLKGVKHLKIKVMGKKEIDTVNMKYIRDAVGFDPLIRIDANGAYKTVNNAINAINNLEKYEIAIVEQPLSWHDLDGLRRLRKKIYPKIMVDESLTVPSDIKRIAEKGAADIINFHPSKLGCLSVTRKAIEETVNLGLEFMIGSAVMTGIGVAAHLQLAASIKKLHYPNEEVGLYEMFGIDVVSNPLKVTNGYIKIPEGYGVGVKVDRRKLERYSAGMDLFMAPILHAAYCFYQKFPSSIKRIVRKV